MPRVTGKTKSSLGNAFIFTTNSGHPSSTLSLISSIVSTAVDYTGQQILSKVDPDVPEPTISESQQDQLAQINVVSSLVIPNNDNGELIEAKQTSEAIEVVNDDGEADIKTTSESGSEKLNTTVSNISNTVEVKLVDDVDLIDLYYDFVDAFLDKGPFYMGNMKKYTELWNLFNNKIIKMVVPDVRLLLYKGILESLINARDMYIDNIRTDKEITVIRNKYKASKIRIEDLLKIISQYTNAAGLDSFCGSLGLKIKQPKPLIYSQAIFNLNTAWYLYLHGSPIKPELYTATAAYVNSFGTKDEAYEKLISLLDEYYKDDNEEFEDTARKIKNENNCNSDHSSSNNCESSSNYTSSELCTSNSGSEMYTTDSEYYYTDEEVLVDIDNNIDEIEKYGDYMKRRIMIGGMLILEGDLSIDISDKYEHYRRVIAKNKKKSILNEISSTEAVYVNDPINKGSNMLVMHGNLNMDLYDKYEKHVKKQKVITRRVRKKRKRKTNKTTKTKSKYLQENLVYKADPVLRGEHMLLLGGDLNINIDQQFESLEAKKSRRKREKRKRKKNKTSKVTKKADNELIYMNDPIYQGEQMLMLKGCLHMDVDKDYMKQPSTERNIYGEVISETQLYKPDPLDKNKTMLVLGGNIKLDVSNKLNQRESRKKKHNKKHNKTKKYNSQHVPTVDDISSTSHHTYAYYSNKKLKDSNGNSVVGIIFNEGVPEIEMSLVVQGNIDINSTLDFSLNKRNKLNC